MELHSYAKRRTLKKWTIEQKRKLVEARIGHDAWFASKPSSLVPWKNILIAANLDDFNVFFVRKQWSNMLARYKQYKQTRLGNNIGSKAIDAELIKRINQEWEFFEPIHKFMTRKTTNLHSYALTHRCNDTNSEQQGKKDEEVLNSAIREQERHRQTNPTPTKLLNNETITISKPKDCIKENIPNNTTTVIQSSNISQDDGIHLFSSDTNEEFQITTETTRIINGSKGRQLAVADDEDDHMDCVRNTDHDFYSKKSLGETEKQLNCLVEDELQEQQSNYFADASEESQTSLNMIVDLLQVSNSTNADPAESVNKTQTIEVKTENLSYSDCFAIKEEGHDEEFVHDMPSTSTENNLTQNIATSKPYSKPVLSEREKYYRHKRRFNGRLEKRFDAILQVMGEVVKAAYPNVDITPLVATVTSMASITSKVLSSDSEDDDESDENNTNIPKSSYAN